MDAVAIYVPGVEDYDCGWNHPRDIPRFSDRHVYALRDALEAILRADMPSATHETIAACAEAILQPYRVLAAEEAGERVYITPNGDVFQYGTAEEYVPVNSDVHFVQTEDDSLFLVYRDGTLLCHVKTERDAQKLCKALREKPGVHWLYLVFKE